MATTKAFHFRAGGGFKATRGFSSSPLARKHAQSLAKRLGHVVTFFFTGGAHHKVKPPKANPAGAKKLFYFNASGGFADTKMYHLAGEARKHAQKLAKDLGRVVKYHMLGGAHHSVKPPKVNPRGGKAYRPYGVIPRGGAFRTAAQARARAKAMSKTGKTASVVSPKGVVVATYKDGVLSNPCKPKKTGKAKNKTAGLGDWVGVKGAQAVRVRRVKGATILDVKR